MTAVAVGSDLFQDVLLSHQFLALSVGFAHHHIQHRLTAVDDICHEENHILQKLDGKPEQHRTTLEFGTDIVNKSTDFMAVPQDRWVIILPPS